MVALPTLHRDSAYVGQGPGRSSRGSPPVLTLITHGRSKAQRNTDAKRPSSTPTSPPSKQQAGSRRRWVVPAAGGRKTWWSLLLRQHGRSCATHPLAALGRAATPSTRFRRRRLLRRPLRLLAALQPSALSLREPLTGPATVRQLPTGVHTDCRFGVDRVPCDPVVQRLLPSPASTLIRACLQSPVRGRRVVCRPT